MKVSDIVEDKLRHQINSLNINQYLEFDLKQYVIDNLRKNKNKEQIYRNIWNNKLKLNKIVYDDVGLFIENYNNALLHQSIRNKKVISNYYNNDVIFSDKLLIFFKKFDKEHINLSDLEINKPELFIVITNTYKLFKRLPFNIRDLLEFHIYIPD